MTRIADETVHALRHGRATGVGTSAVPLTSVDVHLAKGVQLKADEANTGTVFVGGAGVTAGTTPATDGFPLAPGDGLFVPIDRASKLRLIATAASQNVYWLAL